MAPSETRITKPLFEEIELTEDEIEEGLRLAREKKYHEIKKQEWFDKVKSRPVFRMYTSDELKSALLQTRSSTGKKFVIDEENRHAVEQLCLYFAKDARFTGDLDKGILLKGPNGTGKSHLMSFFMQNQNLSYTVVMARAVENLWINETKDEAGATIRKYSAMLPISENVNRFGHKEIGFCFDDLGSESIPSKKFGEEKVVLSEIILNRYDSKLPHNATHITTNLGAETVEKSYGTRIRDRFREMFNVITITGKSRR